MTYIYIKTAGRGWRRSPAHLVADDGSATRCNLLPDEGWQLWLRLPGSLYGRRLCAKCKKASAD